MPSCSISTGRLLRVRGLWGGFGRGKYRLLLFFSFSFLSFYPFPFISRYTFMQCQFFLVILYFFLLSLLRVFGGAFFLALQCALRFAFWDFGDLQELLMGGCLIWFCFRLGWCRVDFVWMDGWGKIGWEWHGSELQLSCLLISLVLVLVDFVLVSLFSFLVLTPFPVFPYLRLCLPSFSVCI